MAKETIRIRYRNGYATETKAKIAEILIKRGQAEVVKDDDKQPELIPAKPEPKRSSGAKA